jgi:methylmalonyl-CoA mutase N-terminal domain/subunit
MGGAVAAIEQGFFHREIEEAAYAAQKEIESGQRLIVGVNAYREQQESSPLLLSMDPKIEAEQIERLQAFRASRDHAAASRAAKELQSDAREDRNLMPAIVDAVSAGVTLGESVTALKEVYGEYRPGT